MDKPLLKIDWATHESADYAVKHWHYSRCMPRSKLVKIGAWENNKFIGVVIFGLGATSKLCSPYGLDQTKGCELVRIALSKHVTPVTKIVAISIRFLRNSNPGLRLIVSFADPSEGHHGGIYQGGGWIYTGRTDDCLFPIIDGKEVHPRQLSRIVKRDGVNRKDFTYILKPGKHRYLMPLDQEMQNKIELLRKPYPKRVGSKVVVASGFQSEEDGSIPIPALQKNE